MKAICSFILALAVSSAGAQIRPVESLPIAVNYSKTIHLVFPSAVKYNQAVTDFVAVDNPESVPNILRIKANRKSFSKQTTVSVATEGGFFYSFNVTYADSLEHTNYFLPDMSSIRPDTIYLNEVSQTHLIAPEKVIYIDYGDTCIQVSKAENTENIVRMIAATGKVEEFPRQTNVSLATEGGKFYTFNVDYRQQPEAFVYEIGEKRPEKKANVILTDNIIPAGERDQVMSRVYNAKRGIFNKGIVRNKIVFSVNNLMVLLAGRVAEEIIFDTITTGAGNDIERATGMARKMVCEWGMSDVVGPMTIGEQGEEVFIGRDWGHARNYSEDTARIVDAEIKKLVETARENCHKLLQENINLLHALAKALLDRETITGDDIDLLVKGEPLPPFDADGSAAKQEPAAPAPASADAGGETFKLEAEPSQDGGTGEKTQDETKQQ